MCGNANVYIKELAALVFPPAVFIVRLTLRAFGTASNICAKASQVMGYRRPTTTGLADDRNDNSGVRVVSIRCDVVTD
jgi:hypothetical protein